MKEVEVIRQTHQFLKSQGLAQKQVVRIYTDAHHTLLPYKELQPFQRFTLDLGDFVLYPDLVGQLDDGESIFAVEAKGDNDLLKGLAQAEMYQSGFHYSFLAADASIWGTSIFEFARRKNVGVISVSDSVKIPFFPDARMPLREPYQFISRQMESVIQVTGQQTFQLNIPTHYLVWAVALQPGVSYPLNALASQLAVYHELIKKNWRGALMGARKLGIISLSNNSVQLTAIGTAVKAILPVSVTEWREIHEVVRTRGSQGIGLIDYQPQAAAILRILLLQDPMVRLVIEGLKTFSDYSAYFTELAVACDRLDHARAPIFFLKPESIESLTDERGYILWEKAKGIDYRSSMFYQYKSILIHAGILFKTKLGPVSTKRYEPKNKDNIWKLNPICV
ncbi:MAG TPA: hypothetical protein DCE56_30530 [Cyanobacteria bacterium UBA8553]|nr:hypothetical protein [Cyanobacteria bacterium UBA8553]HAJ58727.1 hypothetical protein [Cyanobacteria bacterium UBA8543]